LLIFVAYFAKSAFWKWSTTGVFVVVSTLFQNQLPVLARGCEAKNMRASRTGWRTVEDLDAVRA